MTTSLPEPDPRPLAARAPRRHSLSVLMICRDEADRIEAALRSVAGWADQILVLDSGSRDGTVDIARRYSSEVYQTDWPGFGPQRQRALRLCRGDYVLTVDADEEVTPQLRAEIDAELSAQTPRCAVYLIRWQPIFMNRPLRFGRFQAPQLRLFRRQGAEYPQAQVHEKLRRPPGAVGVLRGRLRHDSFRDYRHVVDKHTQYAWLLAQEKHARGERASLEFALLRGLGEFLMQYLLRGALLDGRRGLLMSAIQAQYAFHKYAALWSLRASGAAPRAEFMPDKRQRRETATPDAPP